MGVTPNTMGLTELETEYLALPRKIRELNVHVSATFQHPHAEEALGASSLECILGDNTSPGASAVMRYLMLFVKYAVVEKCADIVQPSMANIDEVTVAALSNKTLLHEMIYALATKSLNMPGLAAKEKMTAEQTSRTLTVFLITELLLKLERPHRPAGEKKKKETAYQCIPT